MPCARLARKKLLAGLVNLCHLGVRLRALGLPPAGLTLEGLVGADVKHVMLGVAAAGATEAFGPAGLFQSGLALRLRAELFKKCGQRQARLKLDAIHCHGMSLLNGLATSMRLLLEKSRAR